MKPAAFKYLAPHSTEEALALLSEHGWDAKVLAGGQSLVPTMNFRLAQPAVLIDLNRIAELAYIRPGQTSGIEIGAMARQRTLERDDSVRALAPLISETMPFVAHPQIRNRGTVGGSIAHADPAAELPAVMLALAAKFRIQSASESRWVAAEDFFIDLFMTELQPEELLTEIAVPPLPPRSGYAFVEVARRHGDYALVGVAAVVTLDENADCCDARLVLMSVGNGPTAAVQACDSLLGQKFSPATIQKAAEIAGEKDIDPPADMHASSTFRRHLVKVLTRRALAIAATRASQA